MVWNSVKGRGLDRSNFDRKRVGPLLLLEVHPWKSLGLIFWGVPKLTWEPGMIFQVLLTFFSGPPNGGFSWKNFTSKRPTPLKINRKVILGFRITWEWGHKCPWESLGYNVQPKFQIIMIRPTKLYLGGCVHGQYHHSKSFRVVGMPLHHGWNDAPNFENIKILLTGKKHWTRFYIYEWRGLYMNFLATEQFHLYQISSSSTVALWPNMFFNVSQWCFWARGDTGRSNSRVAKLTIFHFSVQNLQKLKW